MGRPPIYDRPMTPAERMRRHREKKPAGADGVDEWEHQLAKLTNKQRANMAGCSERHWYTLDQYIRYRAFEWDGDILDGKYGKCGMSFIADVCKHGQPAAQRIIHDKIKAEGAAAARQLWRLAKRAEQEE